MLHLKKRKIVDPDKNDPDIKKKKIIPSVSSVVNNNFADDIDFIDNPKPKKRSVQSHLKEVEERKSNPLFLIDNDPIDAENNDDENNVIIAGHKSSSSSNRSKSKVVKDKAAAKVKNTTKSSTKSISKVAAAGDKNNATESGGRWVGSKAEKIQMCLEFAKQTDGKKSPDAAYERVQAMYGANCPARSSIYQWKREYAEELKEAMKNESVLPRFKPEDYKVSSRGPKVNDKFEKEVKSRLLANLKRQLPLNHDADAEPLSDEVVNLISYDLVKAAIKEVQAEWSERKNSGEKMSEEDMKMCEGHQSDGYVSDFIKRQISGKKKGGDRIAQPPHHAQAAALTNIDIMKMPKAIALKTLKERGKSISSKESLAKIRESLSQNIAEANPLTEDSDSE